MTTKLSGSMENVLKRMSSGDVCAYNALSKSRSFCVQENEGVSDV